MVTFTRRQALAAASTGLVAVVLKRWHDAKEGPVQVVIGIDASLSDRPMLPTSIDTASQVYIELDHDEDRLSCYRMDNETKVLRRGTITDSPRQFTTTLADQLDHVSDEDNTYTELFWQAALQDSAETTLPLIVVLLSDEFSEGTTDRGHLLIQEYTRKLRDRPNLSVAILGASPETWNVVKADTAPLREILPPNRFILSSDRSPEQVITLLNSARLSERN